MAKMANGLFWNFRRRWWNGHFHRLQLTTSGAYLIDSNNTLSINTTNNKAVSFGTGNVVLPYASSTALTVSGTAYLGSLNGPLQANNGLVSATTSVGAIYGGTGLDSSSLTGIAQIVSGTWSASSTLSTAFGGTGWGNIQSNSILLGNGAGRLATTSAGTDGYVLALSAGVPTWLATSTLSTITGTLTVAKGGTGQTSFGQGWLNSDGTTMSASTSPTVNYIVATSTSATSTFPYLSVTTNSNLGTVVGGTWQGTAIGATYGGTGATTHTLGNVLVGNGTSAITSTTTANLKATLALNNVENTALTTWAGSTNLTTLGTIGTGVWNGTTIAVANGGTGLTSGYNNTNWDTAYTNRITSATYPLQISSNVISTALGTTTSNTWAGTQTFGAISNTGGYTQSGTTANTFTGTPTFSNATYSALFTGGNVGIGTTTPSEKLVISSGDSAGLVLNKAGANYASIFFNKDSVREYVIQTRGDITSPNLVFRLSDTTNVMTLNSSGNVGIGTTGPSQKLELLDGDIRLTESGGQNARAINWINNGYINVDDDNNYETNTLIIGANRNGTTGGIDIATFRSDGNVGIGTTGPGRNCM